MNPTPHGLTQEDLTYIYEHIPILKQLDATQQRLLLASVRKVEYQKRQMVHQGDQNCLGLVLIKQGELRASLLSEDGREITLFRLREQDLCLLSASCVLSTITFDVQIESIDKSVVYVFSANIVDTLQKQSLPLENYLQATLLDRFSEVMWTMEQILFKKLDQRVAIFLYDEMQAKHSTSLTLTHDEIAKYIGSAREAVSRILKYFVQEGIIVMDRKQLLIVDKQKLKRLT